MQQHPVPQNVTSYQFRLIGDMTVKQFFLLCIGIGASIFFWFTNLPSIFKWPLIFFSSLFGVALAFFPIEERPLDQWIIAYIKAIYVPTEYIWNKKNKIPDYFQFIPHTSVITPEEAAKIAAQNAQYKKEGISSFLQTLPTYQADTAMEQLESNNLQRIEQLLQNPSILPLPSTQIAANTSEDLNLNQNLAEEALVTTAQVTQEEDASATSSVSASISALPKEDGIKVTDETTEDKISNQSDKSKSDTTKKNTTTIQEQPRATQTITASKKTSSQTAITDINLPFPAKSTNPNTVVGMVLSKDNKLIDNAIIEIRDRNNVPVRATKTNRIGQFFSSTPLINGDYEIEVDRDGYNFDILQISMTGEIVDPIKINAL